VTCPYRERSTSVDPESFRARDLNLDVLSVEGLKSSEARTLNLHPSSFNQADMPATNRDAFGFPAPSESLAADDPLLQPTISKAGRDSFRAAEIKKVVDQGRPVSDSERPILWMMGGGSGVGKSTVLDTLRAEGSIPTEHVVHIDPDAFKEVIPEFRELVKRKESRAAAVVHEESTLMAREAFRQAISRRTDIIYVTTLSTFARA
jgi:hypothetical protein